MSLDVPSGTNATTGTVAGPTADPDRVVTLALPKTGLTETDATFRLTDISIPAGVYERLDIPDTSPFRDSFVVGIQR